MLKTKQTQNELSKNQQTIKLERERKLISAFTQGTKKQILFFR